MKKAKWLVSAAAAAGSLVVLTAPAYADVTSTVQGVQVGAVSTVNTVTAPTNVQVQSTWIYLTVGGLTVPVDPPRILCN